MNKLNRSIVLASAVLGLSFVSAQAAVFDNFDTNLGNTSPNFNGIDGTKWSQTGGTAWQQSGSRAQSDVGGDAGLGTLQSVPIAVGADDRISVDVQSNVHPGQTVEVWGANSGGITSANAIGYLSYGTAGARTMTTDARGYSHVVVKATDTVNDGYGWFAIDNVVTSSAAARTNFTNNSFENAFSGWTTTGTAWNVKSEIGGYYAPEGGSFATSQVTESLTGTLTSPAITVSRQFLTFTANGWGGSGTSFTETGNNYYLLLDSSMTPIARLNNNSAATWTDLSFDLQALAAGSTVYLQAVDGRDGSYGWMAFDYARQTGTAIPEPASLGLLGLSSLALLRRRRA